MTAQPNPAPVDELAARRARRALTSAPEASSQAAPESERVSAGAPTMDPTEWALKAAWAAALEAKASELRKELKAAQAALPELAEGEKGHPVLLPDGTQMGEIKPRAGYTRYSVKDKGEFLNYVSKTHPDQVELSVKPAFQKQMLGLARHDEIPGVGTSKVAPTFQADIPENAYEEFVDMMAENPELRAIIDLT